MTDSMVMEQDNVLTAEQRREERYPCVGIAVLYSATTHSGIAELGRKLQQAALQNMSLAGLAFDVTEPLETGTRLYVYVQQPGALLQERLLTEVRWCRELGRGIFRAGVLIIECRMVTAGDNMNFDGDFINEYFQVPAAIEIRCPACGQTTSFIYAGNQKVSTTEHPMPLYNCGNCRTTRSITGILAQERAGHAGTGEPWLPRSELP